MLLTMAAHEDWLVHHVDVKSTFLSDELSEEVCVLQPPGFIVARHEDVLRLQKALYRFRQAPRV
jgi:hypothetical protein